MKIIAALRFLICLCITAGCASNKDSDTFTPSPSHDSTGMLSSNGPNLMTASTPIDKALGLYTNGFTAIAFDLLLNAFESTHDIRCLEVSCELAGNQINDLEKMYRAHYDNIKPTLQEMDRFYDVMLKVYAEWGDNMWGKTTEPTPPLFPLNKYFSYMKLNPYFYSKGLPSENVKIVNDAYHVLTGEAQSNAVTCFLPEAEVVKDKMLKVESRVRLLVSDPDTSLNAARLMQMQNKIGKQRETLRKLRTDYVTKVYVLPRITLGSLLVYMMKHDQEHVGEVAPGLNVHWVETLEILFNSDNGVLIAQSEQSARLEFKKLVKRIKDRLGEAKYREFVTTLDLLSNNREGGSESWWPEAEH